MSVELLPYERLLESGIIAAIRLEKGERLLMLRPFGWHVDGSHIPNAPEQYSRESVCDEHGWDVVCDYGPYIAVVRPKPATQSWAVTVERNGETVCTLASNHLSGRVLSAEDERVIRMAAEHLLAFIGATATEAAS